MKKEKEIHASFAVTPETAKLWPECIISVKMEMVLNLGWKTWTKNVFQLLATCCTKCVEPLQRLQLEIPWNEWHQVIYCSEGWQSCIFSNNEKYKNWAEKYKNLLSSKKLLPHFQQNWENDECLVLSMISGIHWESWNISQQIRGNYHRFSSAWIQGLKISTFSYFYCIGQKTALYLPKR